MIPYSYNMVDMGGIDLAEANHTVVPGIYEKIVEAINLCGDLILYNWKFADINIVPSAYTVLQQTGSILINGMIQVTELDEVTVLGIEPPPPPIEPVEPLVALENGTYEATPPASGFNPVTVNVPTGYKCFEVYAADGGGGRRREQGLLDNQYFACFFDDNMSSTYSLNGVSATYSTIATGKQQILATTRSVANPSVPASNALLVNEGSLFTTSHGDIGSLISVVGGWVGYPTGGEIYESAAVGTTNSVTLNSLYDTLLIFIGASSNTSGITAIYLNGVTYTIENIGNHYGAYGMYTAIEIKGNTDNNIVITFPVSCWSYMSIIGIDN